MKKIKNLKVNSKLLKSLACVGCCMVFVTGFSGCVENVVTDDAMAMYDVIDSNGENIEIVPQEIDVPGESFKLIVEYSLDDNASQKWRITDNKKITTKVYTKGLPEGVNVYIDNVHTDTTIVATRETMNGITQDSMDDRIHNSLMYGFPISDTTCLISVNEIEGQNETFISGSVHGFNGYMSGSVSEKRFTESDYLNAGVYANKISSSYGLLIQKGDNEPYGIDVSSDIVILACNTITKVDSSGNEIIYTYDRNGNYQETSKQKVKVK
ncbi:MAG: hypothetical protein V8Q75_03730 [Bacilli bacterium]